MSHSDLFIGLISGTSIDGVDCVLVRFDGGQPEILASHFKPAATTLRDNVLRLCEGTNLNLPLLGETDIQIARFFAAAVAELLQRAGVDANQVGAIGSHGQTVWHQPTGPAPFSLQLGDPNTIAELTGITIVADFRRRDMAAGGEGAPLAPLLHRNVFQSDTRDRTVVNIGGIANVTVLPANGECRAFDTGPGNVLMDYWIGKHQQQRFDAGGHWAAQGNSHAGLLAGLMNEPFLTRSPPKSTGRELFNGPWLERKLGALGEQLPAVDVQATLLKFTVDTLVNAVNDLFPSWETYVCGGGAHNKTLMRALQAALPQGMVDTTAALGVDPDWVEAVCFAWLARQTLAGQPVNTQPFTGARKPVLLGGIYRA